MMDFESRALLLESAGLSVVEQAWLGSLPEPTKAWKLLIGGSAMPTSTVPIRENGGHLAEVESKWEELAHGAGILGEAKCFLISVAGVGAAGMPWALVKPSSRLMLAQKLALENGSLEFVAMSLNSGNVCGVTTEEYEVWLVSSTLS